MLFDINVVPKKYKNSPKVQPTPNTELRYIGNRRCHINSLSYAKTEPKVKKIIGCLQVFNCGYSCVHFVVEMLNGDIVDPTFGNMISEYDYIIELKEYKIEEFKPRTELNELKREIFLEHNFFKRAFNSEDDM